VKHRARLGGALGKSEGERILERTNGLLIIGLLLIAAGIIGFAIPVFTTQKTDTVASIGGLNIQATVDTSHHIPQFLSGGAVVLGLVMAAGALMRKR